MTQLEFSELIEKGYAKHCLRYTNNDFFNGLDKACPLFAAFATDFDIANVADADLLTAKDGDFVRHMAQSIDVDYELAKRVSDRHEVNRSEPLEETLALLKAGKL